MAAQVLTHLPFLLMKNPEMKSGVQGQSPFLPRLLKVCNPGIIPGTEEMRNQK